MLFQGPCGYRSFALLDTPEPLPDESAERRYFSTFFAPIRAALRGDFDEFRACWEHSGITAGNRQVGYGLEAFGIAQAQFDAFPWLVKALRAADIRRAKAEGRRAGFMSTQDSADLGSKLEHLEAHFELGLRMLGLSYNVQNAVAGGCMERFDGGVTHLGAELIRQMDELGMIVDTSHSGRRATLDACELSMKPVVASHTSAEALHRTERAKSDDEIRAIAATGGVVGLVAIPSFLAPGSGVTIEAMLDHIDHIGELVGPQHVAIGTDWPLQVDERTLRESYVGMARQYAPAGQVDDSSAAPGASLAGFDDYRDFPNITRGLVRRGHSDEEIRGILGENFLRVFEAVCG